MSWISKFLGLKPSVEEFVEIAKSSLAATSEPGQTISYNKEQFTLTVHRADGTVAQVFHLHNAYDEYCASPRANRPNVLESYLHPMQELPDSLAEAMPNILPRVQRRSFYVDMPMLASLNVITGPSEPDMLHMPFRVLAEHYAVGLIYDTPKQILQISQHHCGLWKSDLDSIYPQAMKNLENLTPNPFVQVHDGVYIAGYADTHDATRMLLIDRIKECKLIGRPVAMVPNRNTLIITGESDPDGIELMLSLTEDALKEPRPMLAIPMVLLDNEWRELVLRPDHPHRHIFEELRISSLADIYAGQKELLERQHEKDNMDVFVASYKAVQKADTKEVASFAAWTEGVTTLLPKTNLLTFVRVECDQGDVVCSVEWDWAQKVVGSLMKPQGIYPERWLVDSFPNAAQIEDLKRYAK